MRSSGIGSRPAVAAGRPYYRKEKKDMAQIIEQKASKILTQRWWAIGLRGLFALLFGVLVLTWPAISLYVLVLLFAAYAFFDGFFAVLTLLVRQPRDEHDGGPCCWRGL